MILAALLASVFALAPAAPRAAAAPPSNQPVVGVATSSGKEGYWLVAADGGVFTFGQAQFHGSLGATQLAAPVVGIQSTPTGNGYWLVAKDGGVFAFGDARFFGSMAGKPLNKPVVGLSSTPTGLGYWLTAEDGGVFAFGDAVSFGNLVGQTLAAPVSGIAGTASGRGYWLVARDGGVFAFGDAVFRGGMGGQPLAAPIVSLAVTTSGAGYWLVGADGGIFSYGDARFHGSMGGKTLAGPMVGIARTATGSGYWTTAADGGLFSFGDARFLGNVYAAPPTGGNPATDQDVVRQTIVDKAVAEIGYVEKNASGANAKGTNCVPRYSKWCPTGGARDTAGVGPWCSVFASWVWQQAGVPGIQRLPYSGSFIQWAQGKGQWKLGRTNPQVGDVVLYGASVAYTGHIGIVVEVLSDGRIVTVEGNYGDQVTKRGPAPVSAFTGGGMGVLGFASPVPLSSGASSGTASEASTTSSSYTSYTYVDEATAEQIAGQNPDQGKEVAITTPSTLPPGKSGVAYSALLSNRLGGTSPYTYSLAGGALPPGLSLSAAGTIAGTPSGPAGVSSFTAKVTDASTPALVATRTFRITVDPVVITTTSLPAARTTVAYSADLTASGGTAPYAWALHSGTLPAGLSLASGGRISGTPTGPAGVSTFSVKVTDATVPALSALRTFRITVDPVSVTTTSLPAGKTGIAYTATLAAVGGTTPYTWSLSAGSLPPGLSLSTTGQISGTPSGPPATSSFTVRVTDASSPSMTAVRALRLSVS